MLVPCDTKRKHDPDSDKIYWSEVTPKMTLTAKEGAWFANDKLVYWTGEDAAEAHAKLGKLYQKQRKKETLDDQPARIVITQLQALNPMYRAEFDVRELIIIDPNTLRLHTKGTRGTINIDIHYDRSNDTYEIKAYRITGLEAKEIYHTSDIYADNLDTVLDGIFRAAEPFTGKERPEHKEWVKTKKLDPQRPIESHVKEIDEEIDQIAKHLADLWIKGEESSDYKHKEYYDKVDWVKNELGDNIWKNVDFRLGELLTRWEKGKYPYQRKK